MAGGDRRTIEAENLETLIDRNFDNPELFKSEVAIVQWKQKSTLFSHFPDTGETRAEIADADVNPFGWRQQHR